MRAPLQNRSRNLGAWRGGRRTSTCCSGSWRGRWCRRHAGSRLWLNLATCQPRAPQRDAAQLQWHLQPTRRRRRPAAAHPSSQQLLRELVHRARMQRGALPLDGLVDAQRRANAPPARGARGRSHIEANSGAKPEFATKLGRDSPGLAADPVSAPLRPEPRPASETASASGRTPLRRVRRVRAAWHSALRPLQHLFSATKV